MNLKKKFELFPCTANRPPFFTEKKQKQQQQEKEEKQCKTKDEMGKIFPSFHLLNEKHFPSCLVFAASEAKYKKERERAEKKRKKHEVIRLIFGIFPLRTIFGKNFMDA